MNGNVVIKPCQNVSMTKECCATCEYMCVEGICHNEKSNLYMTSPEKNGKSLFDYKCNLFRNEKYDLETNGIE